LAVERDPATVCIITAVIEVMAWTKVKQHRVLLSGYREDINKLSSLSRRQRRKASLDSK